MDTNQNLANPEEHLLAEGLANSNQQAFGQLYDKFSASLYSLIAGWVKDATVAENLLQDVFLRAWNNRDRYDESKGRLFTWLYRISRNICIDYYRSRRYKQSRVVVAAADSTDLVVDHRAFTHLIDSIAVREFVNRLRAEEKQVIDLMYYKGFTQCEIATLLAMPLGTVKTRANRAVKNLRRVFLDDWNKAMQAVSLN